MAIIIILSSLNTASLLADRSVQCRIRAVHFHIMTDLLFKPQCSPETCFHNFDPPWWNKLRVQYPVTLQVHSQINREA